MMLPFQKNILRAHLVDMWDELFYHPVHLPKREADHVHSDEELIEAHTCAISCVDDLE